MLRTALEHGDVEAIVRFHGEVYAREFGFNASFETYVAVPLAEFARARSPQERIWIAERNGALAGCIAIVTAAADTAQLRWFLVDPRARGTGLGWTLLGEAIRFSRECGYGSIHLWTVSLLTAAAHLYRKAGFELVDERPGRMWGREVVEEMYELRLDEDR